MSEKEIDTTSLLPKQPSLMDNLDAADDIPSSPGDLLFPPRDFSLRKEIKEGANTSDILDLLMTNKDKFMPWENAVLPSMGIFYDGKMPGGKIQVRPMDIAVEKVIGTTRLARSGQSLEQIYKHCVRFPDPKFDPLDLLEGDRWFILMLLRGITYGNEFEFFATCPKCEGRAEHIYDLNNLGSKIHGPKVQSEPFDVRLPYISEATGREMVAKVCYKRGRHQRMIDNSQTVRNKVTGGGEEFDNYLTDLFKILISSIGDCNNKQKIALFVDQMHRRDINAISVAIVDCPRVDYVVEITCPKASCGEAFSISLPFLDSFFR